jgi:transcriptional regulator with XRE-family HTH domain
VEDIQKVIGNRLGDLRRKKGLSQEKLGWKAKLHYTYIGAIERGEKNVSIITIGKIAKGLGISVNEILNISMDVKDADKLKGLILKEIEKSDPEILKVVLELVKELNALKTRESRRQSERFWKTHMANESYFKGYQRILPAIHILIFSIPF